MNNQQLEIALPPSAAARRRAAKPCRPARAQWWFERMHRVVDAAVCEPAAPTPATPSLHPLTQERHAA